MTQLNATNKLAKVFPILDWGRGYDGNTLSKDLVASLIVTIMLIPQSLAYALLAGLPAEMGIYASIAPILLYAVFGTSKTLAVGPVAVVSLMTAVAVGNVAPHDTPEYIIAALTLAFLSGVFLLLLGILRLGFLANFLSHPVIAGFITASAVIIAASQVKHILGIEASGHNLYELVLSISQQIAEINGTTFAIGLSVILFLFWARKGLQPLMSRLGASPRVAEVGSKVGPVFAVVSTIALTRWFGLNHDGVAVVGTVPQGLPVLTSPAFSLELWMALAGSAALISVIGFVESISVAQTLAAKRRQRIDPDQELIGLGAANMGAAFSGGFPVTGGFSRSVINFDAGAATPAAGAYTAVGLALAAVFLTPLIFYLPKATLAATIIVAVFSLVDFTILRKTWVYSKADFAAVTTTIIVTLLFGIEIGVSAGVLLSVLIHLYKSSKPHIAELGQVPGTEHYRNVLRHDVIVNQEIFTLRVDESLYFANARYLEDYIYGQLVTRSQVKHVILMCAAINDIDTSALESLEAINERLSSMNVTFHLSEVKGPVMDRLKQTTFLPMLTGAVHLSQHQAVGSLQAKEGGV